MKCIRRRGLQSVACSGVVSPSTTEWRRNVVARGMSRFEVGRHAPSQPDWEQLSPYVISVLGHNPGKETINGTNCYLVGTGQRRLLIDTGDKSQGSRAFMNSLADCMKAHDITGLDGIVLTHFHHDHFGNIDNLQEQYGPIPVYSGDLPFNYADLFLQIKEHGVLPYLLGSNGESTWRPGSGMPPGLPDSVDLSWLNPDRVGHHGSPNKGINLQRMFCILCNMGLYHFFQRLESGEYDWKRLRDGDLICTEGATLAALHTPGHTDEHMSFVLQEEHALFSGDHVLGWGTTIVLDMQDYMASLRRMLAMKPSRLYPGHGAMLEEGEDVLGRYIEHRQKREDQAWAALQHKPRPVQIKDIVQELYPDTPKDRMWMAESNIEVLFRKFERDGAVSVWTVVAAADGTESLVPAEVQNDYTVRRFPNTLFWVAKRSMCLGAMKLCDGHAKL